MRLIQLKAFFSNTAFSILIYWALVQIVSSTNSRTIFNQQFFIFVVFSILYIYIYIYVIHKYICIYGASQVALVVKNSPANAGDARDVSTPSQCSCLENSMGRGSWWATVHRAAKSQKWVIFIYESDMYIHIYIWHIYDLCSYMSYINMTISY